VQALPVLGEMPEPDEWISPVKFEQLRRQQFLSELSSGEVAAVLTESINYFSSNPYGSGRNQAERDMLGRMSGARDRLHLLLLQYTAGEPIESLRRDLEQVIVGFEQYGELLWSFTKDRNEPVFAFTSIDDYCQLMQLIGLCFLLHRRDLLPRLASLQDGLDAAGKPGDGNGGTDTLFEEFMAYGLGTDVRYETDYLCCSRPYEALFHALTETSPTAALTEINRYLKRWYKDLGGTAWHDSHKPDESGNQGGYYGYWSFEAGAAVMLMGIEDDSSLHQYLYYPKDLVAWSRAHKALSEAVDKTTIALRAMGNEACPRAGFWVTPAQAGSRQRFEVGQVMPEFGAAYGVTIWQWDINQV
jgi:hypothetical protein